MGSCSLFLGAEIPASKEFSTCLKMAVTGGKWGIKVKSEFQMGEKCKAILLGLVLQYLGIFVRVYFLCFFDFCLLGFSNGCARYWVFLYCITSVGV